MGCLQWRNSVDGSFVIFPRKRPRISSLFRACKNCGRTFLPTLLTLSVTPTKYYRTPGVVGPWIVRGVFPSEYPPFPAYHLLYLQKRPAKHRSRAASDGCANAPEHRDHWHACAGRDCGSLLGQPSPWSKLLLYIRQIFSEISWSPRKSYFRGKAYFSEKIGGNENDVRRKILSHGNRPPNSLIANTLIAKRVPPSTGTPQWAGMQQTSEVS